ncbi:uncharacterized protein LOC143276225 [Babylonia areolata]|uniref:uncharacterized protein LOC143276225 n=1 Tax=Babylonia areolata TaxID=304850 RepID=UPI003FD335EA
MNVSGEPPTSPPPSLVSLIISTPTASYMTSSRPTLDDASSTPQADMTSYLTRVTENDMGYVNVTSVAPPDVSAVDVELFLRQKNEEFAMLVLPAIVCLGVLFVVGVTGNSMVLYVYNRKFQKGTIRWFVQALAIFDLLSCLVAIPGEIIDMCINYTFGSSPMCKVLRTVSTFCTVASGVTLMVVAVERYKRICTPLRKQITPKGAQMIILVCTVAASICAAPACIIYGAQTTPTSTPNINGTDCSFSDVFLDSVVPLAFSSFQFLLFSLGALVLVVLYSLIGRKVWSHAHFRRKGFNRRMSFFFAGSECSSPTTDDVVFAFPVGKKTAAAAAATAVTPAPEDNSNTSEGNNENNDNENNNHLGKEGVEAEEVPADVSPRDVVVKAVGYPASADVTMDDEAGGQLENTCPTEQPLNSDTPTHDEGQPAPAGDGQIDSMEKQVSVERQVSIDRQVSVERQVSIDQQVYIERQVSIDRQVSKEKQVSMDRQVSVDPPASPAESFPQGMDTFRRPRPPARAASRERVKSGDSSMLRGRYRRRSTQHTQSDMRRFLHRSESVNAGTRRTTLMLFLITLVYLLSFLPYLILMIVKVMDEESLSGRGGGWELAHNILLRSYFINSMANPIIYSFCSRTFRKECSKVLHCNCCRSPVFVY